MRKIITAALILASLTGCAGATNNPATTETKTEIATTASTERKTEVTTKAANEKQTEARTERITATTERKTEKQTEAKKPEVMAEDTTGEVDVSGYGWVQLQYFATYHITENHLTRSNGVVYFGGHRETWYSTKEASGQATAVDIPDKHVAEDGTIRDKDGFVCVASSDLPFYSIVMTSVGVGKVYDCGCSSGTIDVYTTW